MYHKTHNFPSVFCEFIFSIALFCLLELKLVKRKKLYYPLQCLPLPDKVKVDIKSISN